jgi:hypothetical protein
MNKHTSKTNNKPRIRVNTNRGEDINIYGESLSEERKLWLILNKTAYNS